MPSLSRRLQEAYAALGAARSYAQWQAAAEERDRLVGADAWRAEDSSVHYDAALLRRELAELRRLRDEGRGLELARLLPATLYRHLADVSAPELYTTALSGTKHLVTAWLDEVEAALRWLAATPVPGTSPEEKLRRFRDAWKVYGRSALMLSGGATWGFHHLGVVKALFEHGLLPHILSGASTGAMVAAGVCARTDAELAEMFADTDRIRLDGLLPAGLRRSLRDRAWLAPEQLLEVLHHNVGHWTFAEAFARSGRALNIPVSPTRTRQKPRLLCHLTSPEVFVASAALASSALPGLFPPVVLHARAPDGGTEPYVDSERWVDGSLYEDLPKLRMARLHNVNHFIVSQTNPHALPFVQHHGRRGVVPALAGLTTAAARTQGAYAAELAVRVARPGTGPLRQLADRAHALVSQDYRGDIDIHPRFRWSLLRKVAVNPTREDLAEFIAEGEKATWPRLVMVDNQTRIGRVFRDVVGQLEAGPT